LQRLELTVGAWTPQQLVALATAVPRDFELGTALGYSNTNDVLLGMLIRQLTGVWWGDEMTGASHVLSD